MTHIHRGTHILTGVGEHKGDSPEEENPGIPITSENSNAEASGDGWVVNFILVFTSVSALVFLFWAFVIMPAYGS